MKITIYQVDAFTDRVFSGNPAAICPLQEWLNDNLMQQIAAENNLAETAFYVKQNGRYTIRWFTPTIEVDLCGHATLASAFVLFHYEGYSGERIRFYSPRSGELSVGREGNFLTLDFPADVYEPVPLAPELVSGFNMQPMAAYKGKTDYMLVFDNEEQIRGIVPNFGCIAQLNARGVIVTAKGEEVDFVSRFFGPQSGVNEDPVTGSAHTTLIPYWAERLQKTELTAMQLSARGGYLKCSDLGQRVGVSGQAMLYLKGEIDVA